MTIHANILPVWRPRLPSAAGLAVRAVCLGSALASAAFYYGWAPHLPFAVHGVQLYTAGLAFAAFLGSVDLTKGAIVKAAFRLAGERKRLQAAGAAALGLVLVLVSFLAVDGLLMKLRVDTAGERTAEAKAWDRAEADYRAAKSELERIGTPRPVKQIQAELHGLPIEATVWRRTAQCTDVTREDSRQACAKVNELRQELAAAERRAEVEQRFERARATLEKTSRPAAGDPQAEALAKASGLDEKLITLALCWLIGLAIEGVTAFGPHLVEARVAAPQRAAGGLDVGPSAGPRAGLERLSREILARGGALSAENREIAALLGVSPGCASKWRAAWRQAGEIVEHKSDGRLVIELGRRRLKAVV